MAISKLGKKISNNQKIGSADKNINNSANFYDIVEFFFCMVTEAPLKHNKD